MKKEKFDIQGMTCSSCSSHVEKAVKNLDGIKNVNVNLLLNNMLVEYDDKIIKNEIIIKAVEEAGYGATLSTDENKNKNNNIDTKKHINDMKKRLVVSICFLIPLMYVAMHNMMEVHFGIPIPQSIRKLFNNPIVFGFTQLLLLLPIIYVNRNYYIIGFKRLLKRKPNMDSLIAIGSASAIIYGIFAIYMIIYGQFHNRIDIVKNYSADMYFESAGMILTLITLGKYLETKAKGKTSDAITKLINLTPKTAIIVRDNQEIKIKTEEILKDDIVLVKPGENIPIDGIIIEGESSIDQSSITGESIPVQKKLGDNVIPGTINKNGFLKVKATKVGNDTTISQIIKLVEEASNSKAPISRLADKVSGIFVPIVITIAILATIIWMLAGYIGIAVLVIPCPCALGLATPVAIMVGTGKSAQNGILIKSAESLELLHKVDTVVFDKTGTLTEGKPRVTDIISNIEQNSLLKIAGSLEKKSEHPLAQAILEKAEENEVDLIDIKCFNSISGRGVTGEIEGMKYYGGNIAFIKENNITIDKFEKESNILLSQGKTVLYFADSCSVIGIIALADTIKDTSYQTIQELKKKNIDVVMITGDNSIVAETIGKQLGIVNIVSEVLPQEKESEVRKLQGKWKKVAFVGDGINDSPALARADIGIAIGSGTDIAIESADIVLINNSTLDVVTAIDLSKTVIKNIKMNLFWAFFYNSIGIPIAGGILYPSLGIKLSPMLGALAMSLSSVCVVTNALRIKKFKANLKKEENKMFTKTITIEGMQCNHCKMSVEKALNSIGDVIKVDVDLKKKTAKIESAKEIENDKIKAVIAEQGFIVIDM